MLSKLWQWLKQLFRRLLGRKTPTPSQRETGNLSSSLNNEGSRMVETQKLNNIDYENIFMQVLEGVHQGWSRGNVKGFFLSKNINEADLITWLQEFGRKLLESPEPDQELLRRMVMLGELRCGEISIVSYEIGIQRLIQEPKAEVWEYDGLDQ
ncbi:MAG: hypothetical protein WBB28_17310 [Crinalium sp.]